MRLCGRRDSIVEAVVAVEGVVYLQGDVDSSHCCRALDLEVGPGEPEQKLVRPIEDQVDH